MCCSFEKTLYRTGMQVAKRRISPDPIGSISTGTHVNSVASAKSRPPIPARPPKPPSSLPNGGAAGPGATAGSKRKASELPMPAPARRRVTPESLPAPTGQPGSGQPAGALPPPAPSQPAITFQQEPQLYAQLGKESIPLGDQAEAGSRVLEAVLRGGQWEIVCHSSGLHQWTDQVPAKVMAVAGSLNFAAAAFESAVLQVTTNPINKLSVLHLSCSMHSHHEHLRRHTTQVSLIASVMCYCTICPVGRYVLVKGIQHV